MRILVAPDKFKGTLSAAAVAAALAEGFRASDRAIEVDLCPLADGGDGMLDVLLAARRGQRRTVACRGPLGDAIAADVGLIDHADVAVIELARAAGLALLPPERRDVMRATTFGVGELIVAALDAGVGRILVGLGGSATCDGGVGIAQALGARLFDAAGRVLPAPLPPTRLHEVRFIDAEEAVARLAEVELTLAVDVLNPLLGPAGTARVFAPQKGATPEDVIKLEQALEHWAGILESIGGGTLRDEPGSGAAGGAALPLVALGRGTIVPGADLVMQQVDFATRAARADLVVTGEGRLDAQSWMGKVVGAVARMCEALDLPCVAVVGGKGPGAESAEAARLDRVYCLPPGNGDPQSLVTQTPQRLAEVTHIIAQEWT